MIPSIDLMNGKAVQLQQGQKKVIERDDVFALLDEFSLYGEVALIDLDAAMGQGDNQSLIEQLLQRKPCRVGGGIRDLATARRYLAAGATKIILGTSATGAGYRGRRHQQRGRLDLDCPTRRQCPDWHGDIFRCHPTG